MNICESAPEGGSGVDEAQKDKEVGELLAKVGAVKTMDGFDINPCGNFEFLFNDDGSLYPRDIEGIVGGLTLLDNFEKVLCYQYPRVFSDPDGIRIDEEKTVRLYRDYKRYQESLGGLKTAE